MKRRIAWLLALLLLVSLPISVPARAEEEPVSVRVLLGTEGASKVTVDVIGTYTVGDTSFTGGTLTASISNGTITVKHSEKGTLYTGTKAVRVVRNLVEQTDAETGEKTNVPQGYDEANLTLTNKTHNAKLTYLGDLVFYVDGDTLRVLNVVGIHEYLYGVVSGEVTDSSHEEVLKTEAICAKMFALSEVASRSKKDFDVYDTTTSQLYYGYKAKDKNVIAAVDAVWDQTLLYQGRIVKTYYCTANGGQAVTPMMHWSGTIANEGAYYFGYDPYDLAGSKSNTIISVDGTNPSALPEKVQAYLVTLASEQLQEEIEALTGILSMTGVHDPKKPEGSDREPSSLAPQTQLTVRMTVRTKAGEQKETTVSCSFADLKTNGGISGKGAVQFVVRTGVQSWEIVYGVNSGHRVGLSHRGAAQMAKQGCSYVDILKFYYRGAELVDANGQAILSDKTFEFTYNGPDPEPVIDPGATPEPSQTPTPSENPTASDEPDPTPTPDATSEPSETPDATSEPSATPEPVSTPTASEEPAASEQPSASPNPSIEPSASPTPSETPGLGDVDGFNGVTSNDARLVLSYYVGIETLTDEQLSRADVNRDGVVDALDSAMILRMANHAIQF